MDWKQIVASVAPMLGTALGGPLGGVAISTIAKALGLDEATEAVVKQAVLGATPDQMLAIKAEENRFAGQMAELGFKNVQALEQIAATDRASARDMTTKTGDVWTPRLLAILVLLAWTSTQWFLLTHLVDTSMRDLIMRMLGTLDAALMMVLAFYYGSSAGSEAKTRMLMGKAN